MRSLLGCLLLVLALIYLPHAMLLWSKLELSPKFFAGDPTINRLKLLAVSPGGLFTQVFTYVDFWGRSYDVKYAGMALTTLGAISGAMFFWLRRPRWATPRKACAILLACTVLNAMTVHDLGRRIKPRGCIIVSCFGSKSSEMRHVEPSIIFVDSEKHPTRARE